MRGTRHSKEQIIAILKQGDSGVKTAELCRRHNITEATYYRWKAKYGGMDVSDAAGAGSDHGRTGKAGGDCGRQRSRVSRSSDGELERTARRTVELHRSRQTWGSTSCSPKSLPSFYPLLYIERYAAVIICQMG